MKDQTKVVLLRLAPAAAAYSGHPRHLFPPLDLKYIESALVNQDRNIVLIDSWLNDEPAAATIQHILSYHPEVVVIKASSSCIKRAVTVATELKNAGAFTIAIGQQVNHELIQPFPGWREAFDVVINGDPEEVVPELIEKLESGETHENLSADYFNRIKTPFLVDNPDTLSLPRFTRHELDKYPFPFVLRTGAPERWGYVLTSWGCPYQCQHCSLTVRKSTGNILRKRSPEKVLDEVEALLALGAQVISFEDDTLLGDREGCLGICREIRKRNLKFPWIANARPTELDEHVISELAGAGAVLLKIGIESGSQKMIDVLGKTTSGEDWIKVSRQRVSLLNRYRIGSVALFMIGCPGETREEVDFSITLAKKLSPDYVQVQIFSLYPDIALYPKLNSFAELSEVEPFHYAPPVKSPSDIPADGLLALQREFYKRFYLRSGFFISHLKRFWRAYLTSPKAFSRSLFTAKWLMHSGKEKPNVIDSR